MADKGPAFTTTFAEASVVKEGYGGKTPPSLKLRRTKGEIAQLVRAHDS